MGKSTDYKWPCSYVSLQEGIGAFCFFSDFFVKLMIFEGLIIEDCGRILEDFGLFWWICDNAVETIDVI